MSGSGLQHALTLDSEYGIEAFYMDNGPATDVPDAVIGSEYTRRTTGDFWKKMSSGWVQLLASSGSVDWNNVANRPTTVAGYGITDALTTSYAPAWSSVTGKPTTVGGYGISDAYTATQSDARYLLLSGGTLTGGLNVAADIHAYRPAASTTGVLYLGDQSGGARYLYYDGTAYNLVAAGLNAYSLTVTNDASVAGAVYASNWFRSYGTTGWLNQTYAGGIYMADSVYVRIYGNKHLYIPAANLYVDDGHYLASQSGASLQFVAPYLHYFASANSITAMGFHLNNGSVAGYVYGDSYGNFGLLNNNGNWGVQISPSGGTIYLTGAVALSSALTVAGASTLTGSVAMGANATVQGQQVATIQYGSSPPTSSTPGIVGQLYGVT